MPGYAGTDRTEHCVLSPLEIYSCSNRLRLARRRAGGRMQPVGAITEKTEEDSRSNRRPIELIGSPACQRSQISDRGTAEVYVRSRRRARYVSASGPEPHPRGFGLSLSGVINLGLRQRVGQTGTPLLPRYSWRPTVVRHEPPQSIGKSTTPFPFLCSCS